MSEDGMLLHIRPRLRSRFGDAELLRLDIEPFGLHLVGGTDLMTKRPYPNKTISVGSRRKGRKAIDGIFVETLERVSSFSYRALWSVGDQRLVHDVQYEIEDKEFSGASDCMLLWYGCSGEFGNWKARKPAWWTKDIAPVLAEPAMELVPPKTPRLGTVDCVNEETGFIAHRKQTFSMLTLERDRILHTKLHDRMPDIKDAFREGAYILGPEKEGPWLVSTRLAEVKSKPDTRDYYNVKIYRDGVEANPKRPKAGTCMLCGNSILGWCSCSKTPEIPF